MPSYESQKEEILSMYNKDGFAREILAEFYEDSSKVFGTEDIRNSFVNYNYVNHINELEDPDDWLTTLGEHQRSIKIKFNRW